MTKTNKQGYREKEIFYLFLHFPNSYKCQGWVRTKSGSWNSMGFLKRVVETQVLGPSSVPFPVIFSDDVSEDGIRSQTARTQISSTLRYRKPESQAAA